MVGNFKDSDALLSFMEHLCYACVDDFILSFNGDYRTFYDIEDEKSCIKSRTSIIMDYSISPELVSCFNNLLANKDVHFVESESYFVEIEGKEFLDSYAEPLCLKNVPSDNESNIIFLPDRREKMISYNAEVFLLGKVKHSSIITYLKPLNLNFNIMFNSDTLKAEGICYTDSSLFKGEFVLMRYGYLSKVIPLNFFYKHEKNMKENTEIITQTSFFHVNNFYTIKRVVYDKTSHALDMLNAVVYPLSGSSKYTFQKNDSILSYTPDHADLNAFYDEVIDEFFEKDKATSLAQVISLKR